MFGKLLCKIGLHKWLATYRPSRCEYYPFDILVSKTCERCGKIILPSTEDED